MSTSKSEKTNEVKSTEPTNKDWEGVDKAPGEEQGKMEQVTKEDLKGKKIDADLSLEKDQPLS